MVPHELLEIFPGLLQLQAQHNGLLRPIACLQQVICLEYPFVASVWKAFEHSTCVEIPDRRPRHDVQPQRSKDAEVNCCVRLFHEAVLLCARADATPECERAEKPLHDELACEGQNDHIEGHEFEVIDTFAVESSRIRLRVGVVGYKGVIRGKRVGEEDGAVEGIARIWPDGVKGKDGHGQDKRIEPRMMEGVIYPSPDPASDLRIGFSSFRMRAGNFGLGIALRGKSQPNASAVSGEDLRAIEEGRQKSG